MVSSDKLKIKHLQIQNKKLKDRYNILMEQQKKMGAGQVKKELYQSPCCSDPQAQQLKNTGKPITPLITSSFEMAREIRTPYDQYWLKVYNSHSMNENYNLP